MDLRDTLSLGKSPGMFGMVAAGGEGTSGMEGEISVILWLRLGDLLGDTLGDRLATGSHFSKLEGGLGRGSRVVFGRPMLGIPLPLMLPPMLPLGSSGLPYSVGDVWRSREVCMAMESLRVILDLRMLARRAV